ncbi:MAG: DUF3291 domain-containing protein [Chloroflexota bacterium]
MTDYHLAQLNIARMLAPIDSDTMSGFVARLDEINALAESTDGFIWRLTTPAGNATALRPFDDDMLIVNMSVWESINALHAYTYKSTHVELIRDRKSWFSLMETPHMVLWWIPVATVEEAKQKLDHLNEHGATSQAFTFSKRFSPEDL